MLDQRPTLALSWFFANEGQVPLFAPCRPCAVHSQHLHVPPARTTSMTNTGSPSTAGSNQQQATSEEQFIYRSASFIG